MDIITPSGVLYGMELVEGKDVPPERPKQEHEKKLGKTAALMMRLTKLLRYTKKL